MAGKIQTMIPQYGELNRIYRDYIDNYAFSFDRQKFISDFYQEYNDMKSFEAAILELVLDKQKEQYTLILNSLKTEIEKSIQPLCNDLRHLEHQLYSQQTNDENLHKDIQMLEKQITDLKNIKSDLTARINTETEHTRQELNDRIISFMSNELSPIKTSIEKNQNDVQSVKEDIQSLRLEIIRHDKDQEVAQVARFDKFKVVITTIVAVIAALSTLSLWLEPPIRTLINIFF